LVGDALVNKPRHTKRKGEKNKKKEVEDWSYVDGKAFPYIKFFFHLGSLKFQIPRPSLGSKSLGNARNTYSKQNKPHHVMFTSKT
jgi:hypothetical protein